MTEYKIIGQYKGNAEEICGFDSYKEAKEMLNEYCTAFGSGWHLWIESD